MPSVYAFQISMPVNSTAPRDRMTNVIHLQHVIGSLADTDLQTMTADIVGVWQKRYGTTTREIMCKAYDTDAVPNYPRATTVVNPGAIWTNSAPSEIALCLSFAGANRGNKSERGRIYLNPQLFTANTVCGLRPTPTQLDMALQWYSHANESLPDLGGVDWQFGVWSKTYKKFTVSQQAWVNDEWDTQRRRGLRETTRVSISRQG